MTRKLPSPADNDALVARLLWSIGELFPTTVEASEPMMARLPDGSLNMQVTLRECDRNTGELLNRLWAGAVTVGDTTTSLPALHEVYVLAFVRYALSLRKSDKRRKLLAKILGDYMDVLDDGRNYTEVVT